VHALCLQTADFLHKRFYFLLAGLDFRVPMGKLDDSFAFFVANVNFIVSYIHQHSDFKVKFSTLATQATISYCSPITVYPVEWNSLNPRIPLIRTFSRSVVQTAFREGADKCGVAKMPV